MSEVSDTAVRSTKRYPLVFFLCYALVLVWFGFLVYVAYRSSVSGLTIRAAGIAALGVIVAPVAWGFADWLRQMAMPTVFLSRGFIDTLGKRFFWAFGPQLVAMLMICVGALAWMLHLTPPSQTDARASEVISESRPVHPHVETPTTDEAAQEHGTPIAFSCTSPIVLKEASRVAIDGLVSNAEYSRGIKLDPAKVAQGVKVKLSDVAQVGDRYGREGNRIGCSAYLSIEVFDEDLITAGISNSIEETSFIAESGPGNMIDLYFPND
jgi:hypothetical protein